jgi:organic hydroperoxide reductase OsmC/OhrA
MKRDHFYNLNCEWTGNTGTGTSGYRSYERSYTISAENKPPLYASSDPAFRGDPSLYNPEDLLVASVSGCHMLWFLHLCSEGGIIVTEYTDNPVGVMEETEEGGGRFRKITLKPAVTVKGSHSPEKLETLHQRAHELCFIAGSLNFPVNIIPMVLYSGKGN